MDLINNLMLGFGVAFTFQNLAYAFGGAVLGTLIGVLPRSHRTGSGCHDFAALLFQATDSSSSRGRG